MGFLIDTNIFVEAERGRLSLEDIGKAYPNNIFSLSTITASELLHGAYRAQQEHMKQRRLDFANQLLEQFAVLPFTLRAARIHAQIWVGLQKQGLMIGPHDLLIAATALSVDYGLITLNSREFRRVANLTVIDPSELDLLESDTAQ